MIRVFDMQMTVRQRYPFDEIMHDRPHPIRIGPTAADKFADVPVRILGFFRPPAERFHLPFQRGDPFLFGVNLPL